MAAVAAGAIALAGVVWFLGCAERQPVEDEAKEPADNSYCLVCHSNYEDEKLMKKHRPEGIGCETCHGMSDKHSADEDSLTAPEMMYAKADINPFCVTCHVGEKILKTKEHRKLFPDGIVASPCCTDCHAKKHHLKVRTRIWDKKSGKLLSDDGVRMMYENSPATQAR